MKILSLVMLVALLPPGASATLTLGDAGDTRGLRVDEPGVLYANCGVGNEMGEPSMDLRLLGGDDLLADDDFQGDLYGIPAICWIVQATIPGETSV